VTVYVDSSVLLRVVTGAPERLPLWGRITRPLSSQLILLECARTIDRARVRFRLDDREVRYRRLAVQERLDGFEIVPLDAAVLDRASEPFPTLIGSLDAIHLASALLARRRYPDLIIATHDGELATAAGSMGMRVMGAPARRR
jgi:predicted nucleic acid-binding protein